MNEHKFEIVNSPPRFDTHSMQIREEILRVIYSSSWMTVADWKAIEVVRISPRRRGWLQN